MRYSGHGAIGSMASDEVRVAGSSGSLAPALNRPGSAREMPLEEAVWVDPARMSGVPCFRGTRLPVRQLFDWLEDGVPLDEFLRDFQIDPKAARAVLRAGAEAICTAAARCR